MLTGRRFAAEEALRFGMLNRVVPRATRCVDAAVELAGLITANSEYGVYMTKLGMWTNLDAPSLRHAMELENRTQVLGTLHPQHDRGRPRLRREARPHLEPDVTLALWRQEIR